MEMELSEYINNTLRYLYKKYNLNMKLIITEKQLKLIVESENKGRLMTIPGEMLTDKESFDKFYNLYQDNKEKKNYIGIKVVGTLDLSGGRYGMKINSSVIKFCDELIEVDGYLRVVDNYAISLPKLKRVDGEIVLSMTEIRELPELEYVGDSMRSQYAKIKSLPMLKYVGNSFDLKNSSIESLPMLKYVGNYLDLVGSNIKSLPVLEEVAGSLYLSHTPIKDLGKLKSVGFDFYLSGSQIESLPMLEYVGGILNLKKTPLSRMTNEEELRNKIEIKGEIYL
jgi:hypothetical protein